MSASTIYTSASGNLTKNNRNWSETRTDGSSDGVDTERLKARAQRSNSTTFTLARGYMTYDTSGIPSNSTITAVTLYWQRNTEMNEQGGDNGLYFCPMTACTPTTSDYVRSNFGTYVGYLANSQSYPNGTIGAFGSVLTISLTTSIITKAGVTKLGALIGNDYSNSAPSRDDHQNEMGTNNRVDANPPYLYIVWTTPPAVTTGAVTDLKSVTATLAGNVTDAGGGTVSERGVCWSLSANPTTSDPKATSAGTTGAYTVGATGLVAGQLYHYRAYVITENSTQYGADVTFRTIYGGNFIPFI